MGTTHHHLEKNNQCNWNGKLIFKILTIGKLNHRNKIIIHENTYKFKY